MLLPRFEFHEPRTLEEALRLLSDLGGNARVLAGGEALTIEGFAEISRGSDTVMAMIAAETLGIPLDKVRVQSGDTDLSMDLGAYSSRQTLMTGHATKEATEQVREQIARSLAEEMGCDSSSISFKNGAFLFDGSP